MATTTRKSSTTKSTTRAKATASTTTSSKAVAIISAAEKLLGDIDKLKDFVTHAKSDLTLDLEVAEKEAQEKKEQLERDFEVYKLNTEKLETDLVAKYESLESKLKEEHEKAKDVCVKEIDTMKYNHKKQLADLEFTHGEAIRERNETIFKELAKRLGYAIITNETVNKLEQELATIKKETAANEAKAVKAAVKNAEAKNEEEIRNLKASLKENIIIANASADSLRREISMLTAQVETLQADKKDTANRHAKAIETISKSQTASFNVEMPKK